MQHPTPFVVHRTPFKKTGLFKVTVDYPDFDRDSYPYPLPSTFITKELNLEDNSSSNVSLNPILSEVFINKAFKSPHLNVARFITIQNSTFIMFFEEANGDFHKIKRANYKITKQWITSVVKGIVHLHLRRILHGDIKASNILIFDGLAKLNDFGSSALIISKGTQRFKQKLYTPTHRPPELFNTDYCDLSADIWALGCTIYEMIYGEPLFKVMSTQEEYKRQMDTWCSQTLFTGSIQFHHEWNNSANIEINNLILKMLNPDPHKRPTIFDIIKDDYFLPSPNRGSFDISSSPVSVSSFINTESICTYDSLNKCSIVSQRLYNHSSFEHDGQLDYIYRNLKLKEEDRELRMLVMCMCESFPKNMRFNPDLVYSLHIIAHLLTHRGAPHTSIVTKSVLFDLLKFSKEINFQYVNWDRFYGVEKHFIY